MRIGVKLLLTYLALVGLVAILSIQVLPNWITKQVRQEETRRLDLLVEKQARYISDRINQRGKVTSPTELGAARQLFTLLDDLATQDTLALVDNRCVILRASRPQWQTMRVPGCETADPKALRRPPVSLAGKDYVIARAPLTVDAAELKGYSLVMFREVPMIDGLADKINQRIKFVVLVALLVALLTAGLMSRELVKRLQAAGDAARAVAEGDLTRRIPEQGSDEITELAGHFNHMAERIQVLVDGLRRSEQARKELLVTVSHELRTPITSISGFAEALRDGVVKDEERKQRYYQIIAAESSRMTRLINDLFDVSKLETGQLELRMQAMAVAPWLAEFADAQKPAADGVSLQVETAPAAGAARIYGDRDRLDQVLTNLVSNAVRFAPPGSAVVLGARLDGEELVLEVTDRGPGLAPEEAGRVFDRFFQGQNTGNGHKGAGLGLAIVKSLVEAHGGSVGVISTPGQGATFWVRLKTLR